MVPANICGLADGFLATRADLVSYQAMLLDARDRMARLIADGKSEAEVTVAKPFADDDKNSA